MISVQSTGDRSPNQVVPLEVQILEAARGWALAHPPRAPGLVNNRAPHAGSDQLLQTRGTAFHTGLIFSFMARVGLSSWTRPCPLSVRSRGEGTGLNAQSGRFLSLLWRETHPTSPFFPSASCVGKHLLSPSCLLRRQSGWLTGGKVRDSPQRSALRWS